MRHCLVGGSGDCRSGAIAPASCKIEGGLGAAFNSPNRGRQQDSSQIHNNMPVILNLLNKVKIEERPEII